MRPNIFLKLEAGRSDRARARLLEAAANVFGEKGLKAATVREIAREAGQNVAAIKYYFGGKQELYHAVLEGITGEMRRMLADVVEEVERLRHEDKKSPTEALRLFKLFLRAVYLRVLSHAEVLPFVRLVVREQMQPTIGFDILFERAFRPLHEALSFLVGTAMGQDPASEKTIVRTHTLMGQIYFFAMSREAILRRLKWKSLEGKHAELVADVVSENVDILMAELGRRRGSVAKRVEREPRGI